MADYGEHLGWLVKAVLVLVGLFLLASMLEDRRLVGQVFWALVIIIGVVWILARFGGDLGRTV
jgi:hypothetical protein